MALGAPVTVKKRKVIYDEYTGGFYAESKVESLQRQCDCRARLTGVINKAEHAKYRVACKQVDAEKQIFLTNNEKALHRHNETLLDNKAHMNVLHRLAKERREGTPASREDLYGRYPPKSLRTELDEEIVSELKEMSPVVQRRREATRLLLKRNGMSDVDRTMATDDMFLGLKERKSRISSPVKSLPASSPQNEGAYKPAQQKAMPKLILPAITVRMGRPSDRTTDRSLNDAKSNEVSVFPSVFVTDSRTPLR